MSLKTTSGADLAYRTATAIDHNAAYTILAWFRIDTDVDNYAHFIHVGGTRGAYDGNTDFIGTDIDGTTFRFGSAGGASNTFAAGAAIPVGSWFWAALVRETATSLKAYRGTNGSDGTLVATVTDNVSARAAASALALGGYNGFPNNGLAGRPRIWTKALALAGLHAEVSSASVVDAVSLWSAPAFAGANVAAALLDTSGNSRDFSQDGTLTLGGGEPPTGGGDPSITSTSSATPSNGASLTITGTAFGATQGAGGATIGGTAQTETSWADTSIPVTVARGINKYGVAVNVVVTDNALVSSSPYALTSLQPQAGWSFVNLSTLATSGLRITAIADLASGDQLAYDSVGGLVEVFADGTFSADASVASFGVEAWTPVDGWGSVASQSIQAARIGKVWRRAPRLRATDLVRSRLADAGALIANSEFWLAPSAPSGVGTSSSTLAGVTMAATSKLNIAGTLARTLAGVTMTANSTNASPPVDATVTTTLDGVTQAAKGIHGNSPASVGSDATADNPIFKHDPGNYGTLGSLYVSIFDAVSESRSLLKTDMSTPSGTYDVLNATLKFQTSGVLPSTQRIVGYRVLRAWTELGSNWATYDGTNSWTTPGAGGAGDIDPVPVFVFDVPAVGAFTNVNIVSGGLNTLVEKWIDGTYANNGLLIVREAGPVDTDEVTFLSRETGGAGKPQITFDYQTPYTGVSSITGTLSATLAGVTMTGFSVLPIAATVANTLAGATMTSTATLLGKLNATQTLPAFSQTATATVSGTTLTITASQTLPAFGQTATVAAGAALSAAQTLPAFGQTATMSAPAILALTASQTLPAFAQTATAVAITALSATQALPAFGQTATVAAIAKLNASQALPDFTQTATAVVVAVGSATLNASQQLPDFGQTATAVARVGLTAAQTLPAFGQTATATVRGTITAAQTLPAFGQTATVSAPATLTASQTLPAFGQTATATQVRTITAAQTLPAFGQTATLSTARVITASQQLPDFGQTATAVARIVLSAVQTMPAFTQFASMSSGMALSFVANERTYILRGENRTFGIAAEQRRHGVANEDRMRVVPATIRSNLVN